MHPVRRFILIRWLAGGVLLAIAAGVLAWTFYDQMVTNGMRRSRGPETREIILPDEHQSRILAEAVDSLRRMTASGPTSVPDSPDPALMPAGEPDAPTTSHELALIFESGGRSMAVIGGTVRGEGETLSDGSRILHIGDNAVLLETPAGVERLQLRPRSQVRLALPAPADADEIDEDQEARSQPPSTTGRSSLVIQRQQPEQSEESGTDDLTVMKSLLRKLQGEIDTRSTDNVQ